MEAALFRAVFRCLIQASKLQAQDKKGVVAYAVLHTFIERWKACVAGSRIARKRVIIGYCDVDLSRVKMQPRATLRQLQLLFS